MKKLKSGIYFNDAHGYFAYCADTKIWMTLIDGGYDEEIAVWDGDASRDITLTYVAKDILELYRILKQHENTKVPEHVLWSQKHLAS